MDLVGYGTQNLVKGGGPCGGSCKPTPGDLLSRFVGTTSLVAVGDRVSLEYIKLHANRSGTCFGDSGGPELLGGTDILLAENSFVLNDECAGVTYGQRLDTPETLTWISTTAAANGGSLHY